MRALLQVRPVYFFDFFGALVAFLALIFVQRQRTSSSGGLKTASIAHAEIRRSAAGRARSGVLDSWRGQREVQSERARHSGRRERPRQTGASGRSRDAARGGRNSVSRGHADRQPRRHYLARFAHFEGSRSNRLRRYAPHPKTADALRHSQTAGELPRTQRNDARAGADRAARKRPEDPP